MAVLDWNFAESLLPFTSALIHLIFLAFLPFSLLALRNEQVKVELLRRLAFKIVRAATTRP